MGPAEQAALDQLAAGVRDYAIARRRLGRAAEKAAESMRGLCAYLQEAEQREFIQAMAAYKEPAFERPAV